jgi:hypothetical protein
LREFAVSRDRGNALGSPSNDPRPLERPMKHGGRDQRSRPEPPRRRRSHPASTIPQVSPNRLPFAVCSARLASAGDDKMAGHQASKDGCGLPEGRRGKVRGGQV